MRIAHLSDPHLTVGPLAAQPAAGLAQAVARVLALEPRPDCMVITGDLADTGNPDEYTALQAILDRCPIPIHLTTGNHDDPQAMVAQFSGTRYLGGGTRYAIEYPGATVVVADSHIKGSPAGLLGVDQLAWIDETLAARPDIPAVIALHHPPVRVGVPFLDGMRLNDGPALAEVVRRHPQVVRVLTGHIHRSISAPFAGSLVTVAPSTYRQSHLRMHDDAPPGYLAEPTGFLLHWIEGRESVTHTVAASHASAVLEF